MFERALALFGFHKQYTYYERALEKIDLDLQSWNKHISALQKKRERIKRWAWIAMCLTFAVALIYAGSLKRPAKATLTAYQHVTSILTVLAPLPLPLMVYLLVPPCFDIFMEYGKKRKQHLEEQRRTIIKDLKDSTRFDVISKIIDKYDPEAKAAKQAALANARKQLQTPMRGRVRPATSPGAAVFSMLQSTGQALSPLCDRIAGLLADDPSTQAAFGQLAQQLQQAVHEKAALERQNYELRLQLSKYEDVSELDMQENTPPGARMEDALRSIASAPLPSTSAGAEGIRPLDSSVLQSKGPSTRQSSDSLENAATGKDVAHAPLPGGEDVPHELPPKGDGVPPGGVRQRPRRKSPNDSVSPAEMEDTSTDSWVMA